MTMSPIIMIFSFGIDLGIAMNVVPVPSVPVYKDVYLSSKHLAPHPTITSRSHLNTTFNLILSQFISTINIQYDVHQHPQPGFLPRSYQRCTPLNSHHLRHHRLPRRRRSSILPDRSPRWLQPSHQQPALHLERFLRHHQRREPMHPQDR